MNGKDKFRTLDDPDPPPPKVTTVPLDPAVAQRMMELAKKQRRKDMMVTASLVFLVLGSLSFVLAAFNATPSPRVNMMALGLFFWTVSILLART